jgi:hypothetical protein
MSDVLGGACVFLPVGQLLLSPGVLAEQLDGKGFSVPTLSRFSRAFSLASVLPPSTLRLRGQTADANNSAESEKPQSCTTRRLAAVAACHWIEIVLRRLLRLAAISIAAAREPRFYQHEVSLGIFALSQICEPRARDCTLMNTVSLLLYAAGSL